VVGGPVRGGRLDGPGPGGIFWRIVLPLSRPALAALAALATTWIFNDLIWAMMFVDARAGQERFQTLNGPSDHGEVWSRPSAADGDGAARVITGDLSLRRSLSADDGVVRATYGIDRPPGAAVLHAVHLLPDVGPGAPGGVLRRPGPGRRDRPLRRRRDRPGRHRERRRPGSR
jgi:hypothetical protein